MSDFDHKYSDIPSFKTLNDIKDKKVTVMGLGLNGGGEAVVRFLVKHGAFVTVTDMKTEEQLSSTIKSLNEDTSLDSSRIRYVLGKHELSDFESADVVIKNPGVKYGGNKFLAAAKSIETDLSIFLHFTNAPIIAVTGSKGKSSTVSAIHYGLTKAGFKCFLGGNITVSPLTFLEETNEKTPVVLELSSWQLSDLHGRKLLKPYICVITKVMADHQNWYGAMEPYVADKKLIYADQDKNDFAIFTKDDEWGNIFASECNANILRYSSKTPSQDGCWFVKDGNGKPYGKGVLQTTYDSHPKIALEEVSVPGNHMKEDLLNAALVMRLMQVPVSKIKEILATFPGIQHRLEFFHEWKNSSGVSFRFYNDSASTVPDSTVAAINAFETAPILLSGGTDKVLDFTPLANEIHKAAKVFLLSGTGTDKLLPLLDERKIKYETPCQSLAELFTKLKSYLETIESCEAKTIPVLFSPGATSFGMFSNEFDRGNKYKSGVLENF